MPSSSWLPGCVALALVGCVADPGAAPCAALRLEVKQVRLARSIAEADRVGFDLDRDPSGRRDDALGFAIAWLDGGYPGLIDELGHGRSIVALALPDPACQDGPAAAEVPLVALLGGPADAAPITVPDLRVELDGNDAVSGRIGFSIAPAELAPARARLAAALDEVAGADPLHLDRDHDGTIEPAELAEHPFAQALLWPDLDTPSGPRLSFGLAIAGVLAP